jgi:hypothetical protein
MIEEAEEAENLLFGEATEVPGIPRSDPQSIPVAVLEMLSAAHHQRVLPSDIPALLEFLQAEPGRELDAWARFDQYWEAVDWEARGQLAQELYFTTERLEE